MSFATATIQEIETFGKNVAQEIVDTINIDDYINDDVESVSHVIELMNDDASEAWGNYTSYSPFEFYAKEINSRDDSDEAWQALEDAFFEAYSEAVENMRDDIKDDMEQNSVSAIDGVDVPEWIESDITLSDVANIQYGGCVSGAYMPAVTYHLANEMMSKYGDDVLQYIQDNLGEIPAPNENESWSGLACYYLSMAVELWVSSIDVEEILK